MAIAELFIGGLAALGLYCLLGGNMILFGHSDRFTNTNQYLIKQFPKRDFHGYELSGMPPNSPAFELGFGMGPGLYGTAGSRATSTMVGN